jgi:hypothetical protein
MKEFYVYVFLRPDRPGHYDYDGLVFNMEPFYIGKGSGDRISDSEKYIQENSFKCNVINKIHQLNLIIKSEKLMENLTEAEAFICEEKIIKQIGRRKPSKRWPCKKGPLVNLTNGGEGYAKKPVLQYDMQGNFIKEFPSVGLAMSSTKISNISLCCRMKIKMAGKYIWRYKEKKISPKIDVSDLKNVTHGNYPKAVIQYDINGNILSKFDSIKEAMEKTGCHTSNIVQVCKGHREHTHNFIWRYEDSQTQTNKWKKKEQTKEEKAKSLKLAWATRRNNKL